MSANGIRPPQQARGLREVAPLQGTADARAGHALAICKYRFNRLCAKAQGRAHGLQQCQIAAACMPKAKARAHPHFACVQARHQHRAHKLLRRHLRHRCIEAQQTHAIAAQCAQALGLGTWQHQARWQLRGSEELTRQGFEAEPHCRHTQHPRTRHRVAHQRTMPQVQAIESTDADHAPLWAKRRPGGVAEEVVHEYRQV